MRISTLVLLLALACSWPTAPDVLGSWGGQEASLVLTSSGGALSYACGAGTIDAWTLRHAGQFIASGQHFFGGGPVPPQGRPPHPARYTGQVQGNHFILTVTLTDLNQTLGPFQLVRGGPAVVDLCV